MKTRPLKCKEIKDQHAVMVNILQRKTPGNITARISSSTDGILSALRMKLKHGNQPGNENDNKKRDKVKIENDAGYKEIHQFRLWIKLERFSRSADEFFYFSQCYIKQLIQESIMAAEGQFKKSLNLFDSAAITMGSMIGSGIFIVSADIARNVGSPGWILVVWGITRS